MAAAPGTDCTVLEWTILTLAARQGSHWAKWPRASGLLTPAIVHGWRCLTRAWAVMGLRGPKYSLMRGDERQSRILGGLNGSYVERTWALLQMSGLSRRGLIDDIENAHVNISYPYIVLNQKPLYVRII